MTHSAPEFVRVVGNKDSSSNNCAFRTDDLWWLKFRLDRLDDPSYINLPLFPYHGQAVPRPPWLNETALGYAIKNGNFEVIEYLLTEWEHRDVIIKDRCICHPLESQGITLPPLLLTILCQKSKDIDMTNAILELLTTHFKPDEIGMNWVCDITLREQMRYYGAYGLEADCEGLLFMDNNRDGTTKFTRRVGVSGNSISLWGQ